MQRGWFIATVLSCLLISGCLVDDSEDSACILVGEATIPILVSIGCGSPRTQPLYLWDDQDGVGKVEVMRTADDQTVVWGVFDLGLKDSIEQPIQHGVSSPGTQPIVETEINLELGVEYLVRVSRFFGGSGTRKFTILPKEETLP